MSRTLLLLMLVVPLAWAQQYRWVDEQGRVHYTDTPPPPSAKSTQKKNLKGSDVGQQESFELMQAVRNAPVTLYTFTECQAPCQMARDVLNKRGVPFREKQVSNQQMLDELQKVSGGTNVPVMVVGTQVERNASPDTFNQALDNAGYPRAGVARPRNQQAPPKPPVESEPSAPGTPVKAP